MKTKIILLALAFSGVPALLTAQESKPAGAAPGHPAAEAPSSGFRFHAFPPGAREKLNLTAEQQTQVTALENEFKARLEKILTPAQLQELQKMRPPHGGPRGGKRGPDGPEGEDRPQPPPAK